MTKKIPTTLWLFLLIACAYIGLRSHTLLAAFPHDEGLFLYGGQAWANGELAYRDFWDHKPPATFFFHSIPLRLFPFSIAAVKIHECLWLALSALLLFALCRRRFSRAASFLTLAFYIFYTSLPYTIRTGGLTEENALFFVVLSFYLILRKSEKPLWSALWAGLALGAAVQFRQTFIFESLFLLGAALHSIRRSNEARFTIWKPGLALAAGMILPEILVSLYFLIQGAWFDYFEASYLINFFYVGPARPERALSEILAIQWTFIRSTGPYLLSPLLAFSVYYWIPKTNRWMLWPLLAAFLGDACAISLSGEYYEHYYVQAAASSILLLALFLDGLEQAIRKAWNPSNAASHRAMSAIFSLLLITITAYPFVSAIKRYESDVRQILQERSQLESTTGFQQGAAQAIRDLTDPEDRILLIGRDPNSIYIQSKRYAGSRFYHFTPLWKEKLEGVITARHMKAFMQDLSDKRPAILLIDRRSIQKLLEDSEFMQQVNDYFEKNYTALDEIVEESPEDLWFWYGPRLTFLIRNDKIGAVKDRYARIAKQSDAAGK
ncbi:MAG: glycosyltransferase family 39 protein [Candidatus Omnitrophica bacterium]|nr:glycosyltransferase family 39 protein [Candidatus Omnitrophota bacterium]